jgi:hypothetical protein
MSKKNALIRRPQVVRPLPRLPHPSWRQALVGGDDERSNVSADDFWSRLGL